jgi:Replication-relaxation
LRPSLVSAAALLVTGVRRRRFPQRGFRVINVGCTVASAGRLGRTYQEATTGLISGSAVSAPRRTPYSFSRPFLIREHPRNASQRLTQKELNQLARTLTTRDIAILLALSNYRYLDRDQVARLFFPTPRVSQRRIKWLKDRGLIYRWLMIEPPGWTRLHSLLLLSPRGARVLANCLDLSPRSLVRLSEDARDHCFNVGHDLGANAFFVALAGASRDLPNEGLYHWVGESRSRRILREAVGPKYAPAPDGWGRYLLAGREIIFFLEWDRGTESIDRLQRKAANYIRYFVRRIEASSNHIFFVLPSSSKELAFHKGVAEQLPRDERCCVFWTTTVGCLAAFSPRGPVWWRGARRVPGGGSRRTPSGERGRMPSSRVSLESLAGQRGEGLSVGDCIGKPRWWERRLAGGQV